MRIGMVWKSLVLVIVCTMLGIGGCKSDDKSGGSADGTVVKDGDRKAKMAEKQRRKRQQKAKRLAARKAKIDRAIAQLQTADKARLLQAMNGQNHRIRTAAVNRLMEIKETSKEVMDAMIPLLAAEREIVRNVTMKALIAAGEPAVPSLIDGLRKDQPYANMKLWHEKVERNIGFNIVRTLVMLKEVSVKPVIAALKSGDNRQKEFLVRSLGLIGEPAKPGLAQVLKLTKDKDVLVSGAALMAAVKIDPKNPKVARAVTQAISSSDKTLVARAEQAKVLMDGKQVVQPK